MAGARTRALSERVVIATKQRIVDTLAAIVSGARLLPGQVAIDYVRALGGTAEACVATTSIVATAVNAAFANAMCAHADETDDFHPFTKAHPGCSVVPAALAMAERERASGATLIAAVVLGYDIGCRFLMALGPDAVRASDQSAEGVSSTFGAAAAAASIAGFDERRMRYAISYAAQQTSGVWSWERDEGHIEKAFDFAGMGARNGVMGATMIAAGFTGVADALDAAPNVFRPLAKEKTLAADNVRRIVVRLPADGARIVDNSAMPDVNLQHLIGVALVDGGITFASSHERERLADPRVLAVRSRVELVADPALVDAAAPRSGLVEVTTSDGRRLRQFVKHARGMPENPLDTDGVSAKARGLMAPVLGARWTDGLIEGFAALERLADVRELRPLLTG